VGENQYKPTFTHVTNTTYAFYLQLAFGPMPNVMATLRWASVEDAEQRKFHNSIPRTSYNAIKFG